MPTAGPSKTKARGKSKSKARDLPSFPEDFDPSILNRLKVVNIRKRLSDFKIVFPPEATKPELTALFILSVMDLCTPTAKADADLVETVTEWCRILVSQLHVEVERRGMEVKANKWLCIEALIQHE